MAHIQHFAVNCDMRQVIKMEREEILAALYAIRAGLSVVSSEKDRANAIMTSAKNQSDYLLCKAREKINELESEEARAESNVKVSYAKLEDIEKNKKFRSSASSKMLVVLGIIAVILACVALCWAVVGWINNDAHAFGEDWRDNRWLNTLYGWMYEEDTGFEATDTGFYVIVGTIVLSVIVIFLLVKLFISAINHKKRVRMEINIRNKQERELIDERRKRDDLRKLLDRAREEYKKTDIRCRQLLKEAGREAQVHVLAGMAVIKATDNAFGNMLDMRDWKNIDYIIFALETRRVDNMKEALSFADWEIRTEKIVGAVREAVERICSSVNSSIGRLRQDMNDNFKRFSDQMNMVAGTLESISMQVSDIAKTQTIQTAYLTQISSETHLGNVMQAKSSATSEQLAGDASRIRQMCDNAELRRRIGV